jgi:hypothetical protein
LNQSPDDARSAENHGASSHDLSEGERESTRDGDPTTGSSRPLVTGEKEPPTDADLERGILDAVKLGLADVARTLNAQLEERRRARGGNVISLPVKRGA